MKPRPSASWKIERAGGRTLVEISGHFDENVDLRALKQELEGEVEFDLAGVVRVNSTGIRAWVDLIHDLPSVTALIYSRCSPAIVTQLNTIYNFRGPARVASILAPYVCETCSIEEFELIDLTVSLPSTLTRAPEFRCHRCGGEMAFDDLPERYFSFLKES